MACGDSGASTRSYEYDTEITDDDGLGDWNEMLYNDYDDEKVDVSAANEDFQLTGIVESCRHCNGYGMVQDGLYGVAHYCKFCGGQRVVDAAVNLLPDDFFDATEYVEGYGSGGYSNTDDIRREIARHIENILDLEHQLEYIEGDMNRNYIQQQIIQERYVIERLQRLMQ